MTTEVYGHSIYKGMPCQFVETNVGCSIYESRPEDPCENFNCIWKTDESVPLWMKPSLSNAIVKTQVVDGHLFVVLLPTGKPIDENVFSWFILWAVRKYVNVVWQNSSGSEFFIGTQEFNKAFSRLKTKNLDALI